MLGKVKNSLLKINQVIGVDITLMPEEKMIINCVQLSIKKNVLTIDQSWLGQEDINKLSEVLDKNLPLSISISGRGILQKKVLEHISDLKKAVHSLLPNARPEDFYAQECPLNKGGFYSIIRKGVLDDTVDKLKIQGFTVINATLGPFAVVNLLPLISSNYLQFAGHRFNVNNSSLEDYQYLKNEEEDREIKLDSEQINENALIAYALAFQTIFPVTNPIVIKVESIEQAQGEFKYKKAFKVLGWGALLFFLTILMANFLLFNYLNDQNKVLVNSQSKFTGLMTDLDTLQKKVREKEVFLIEAGWMSPSQLSYYSDKIASIIPASILLTELSINPVDMHLSKQEKVLAFMPKIIHISGYCHKATDLNPWIKNIDEMDWVNKVEVENYTFDNKERKGSFLITIHTK